MRTSSIDEAKEEVRKLRAVYRIVVSEDGKMLFDALQDMAEQRMAELMETVSNEQTQIVKGQCMGIRDVIAMFANVDDLVAEAEEEVRDLERDLTGIPRTIEAP